jgi:hypothetical protein
VAGKPPSFLPWALLIDLVVWAAILAGTVFTVERWRRKNLLQLRVTLKFLLALLVTAGFWFVHRLGDPTFRDLADFYWVFFKDFAPLPLFFGILCAWMAFLDLLGIAWIRATRRRLSGTAKGI